MSASGINYLLLNSFGSNERLAAYYDFSNINSSTGVTGSGPYSGLLFNNYPAFDTGSHEAVLLNITGATAIGVGSQLSTLFSNDNLNLSQTNLRIPIEGLSLSDMSVLMDFDFNNKVYNGILFGTFEKFQEGSVTGSKGFNVGVNDRGHLFLQTYSAEGDQITTFAESELSKRNIIGISSYGDSIILSKFDYLNNRIDSKEIPVNQNYIADSDYIYIGGSKQYFRSNNDPSIKTFSGNINEFAIFSGAVSDNLLNYLGLSLIGDYFQNDPVEITGTRVTGYQDTILYRTGVTGYTYNQTGTLTIATGREIITSDAEITGVSDVTEGTRYYKYYTLSNSGIVSTYKEEIGYLHPDSAYIYSPTGENAFATLGLQEATESIEEYLESQSGTHGTITIPLYGKTELTGTLNEISGVTQIPLTEQYITYIEGSSGISLSGDIASGLQKNYIYFLEERF